MKKVFSILMTAAPAFGTVGCGGGQAETAAAWQKNADWLYERGLLSEQTDVSFMVAR